jgi:KipI family sensor histidine kinase inhibitor
VANLGDYPRFLPVGDTALAVEFGDAIDPQINAAVIAFDLRLAGADLAGIVETVPTYRSLLVRYDPVAVDFTALVAELRRLIARLGASARAVGTRWSVPVVYDPPFAADLEEVAERLKLSSDAIVALHAGADYHVYTVGFAPGIPLLGGLPAALHIPRRQCPRPRVPDGAVMIGGMQAALVSMPVPSGWYILGQTPLRAFDPERQDPFLFRPGDRVRFRRIDAVEYARLADSPSAAVVAGARMGG